MANKNIGCKRLVVWLAPDVHQAVKDLASLDDRSLQAYGRRVVEDHVSANIERVPVHQPSTPAA